MDWSGHWHGYGWTGTRDEYGRERLRRPGPVPGDEQTRDFLASALPPMMTGHALLRKHQAAPDRTWTTAGDAVDWLARNYADRPPSEHPGALLTLEARIQYAAEFLPLGMDAVWAYYQNGSLTHHAVVCCPSRFHSRIPCPLPPS